MRKTSMGLAALGAAAALTLAACASGPAPSGSGAPSPDASQGGGDKKPYIAIISKGFQHQFWQAVKLGAEQKAAELNVEISFEGPATEADVENQMTMLQNALAKNPAALGFAALDSKAAGPVLQQFADANIPVIAFDSGVDSDIPLTNASTDNVAAAAEAGKHMCELIGGKGKVAVISTDQVGGSAIDRRDGFIQGIQANCPEAELLETQYGAGDQAKSADIAKSILQSNPDLAGLFGVNEGSAIGALKGFQEAGDAAKNVKLVGFDSGQAQIDAITNGTMAGAITQNPVGMGATLVEAAVKAINGETLPKTIDTGFYWYDASNINNPEIQAVLYQ